MVAGAACKALVQPEQCAPGQFVALFYPIEAGNSIWIKKWQLLRQVRHRLPVSQGIIPFAHYRERCR